jgi:lipid II:glycine glycyltransferase (peptidoglycan interpeptide bridge formation enzyme)
MYKLSKHIVQSSYWEKIKSSTGAKVINIDGLVCTLSKIPLINFYIAYVPKISPDIINFDELRKVALVENIFVYRFDVPFIIKDIKNKEFIEFNQTLSENCVKSPTDTFTKYDILLDLQKPEEEIIANFKSKTRYNINYAIKNDVKIKAAENDKDFDEFWGLMQSTAKRQHYYIRSKEFYYTTWKVFKDDEKGAILTATYKGEALASWFLSFYEGAGNYMYGGPSTNHQNLQASSLLASESIKLAKQKGATYFDFWGSDKDLSNPNSKFYGVTRFKLGFGGEVVEYMDSYDFVVNTKVYQVFVLAYKLFRKLVELKR